MSILPNKQARTIVLPSGRVIAFHRMTTYPGIVGFCGTLGRFSEIHPDRTRHYVIAADGTHRQVSGWGETL